MFLGDRDAVLQFLCRGYLSRLRVIGACYGLGEFIDSLITANERGECHGTEQECELLARIVDEERVTRADIPHLLGCSYRSCYESGIFDIIRRLPRVGVYSRVSTLLNGVKSIKNA